MTAACTNLRTALVVAALLIIGLPLSAETQSLARARELYVAAAYDEALAMLNALGASDQTRAERQTVGIYRVLCLVALGRTREVDAAVDTVIAQDPFQRLALDDLPPKTRTAFADARRRMLPAIVQQRYSDAKASFDRGEYAAAAPAFREVLDALTDPDLAPAVAVAPLSDIRVLAGGFHDLSVKALAPPPAPAVVVAPPPPAPVRDYRKVYTPQDTDATPPVVIRQAFPPFKGKVTEGGVGVVEVVIDATGAVESATIVVPVHPQYDRTAVEAARRWQYRPATVDGVPVKYIKRVQVTLAAQR
jgi:TonB family protein